MFKLNLSISIPQTLSMTLCLNFAVNITQYYLQQLKEIKNMLFENPIKVYNYPENVKFVFDSKTKVVERVLVEATGKELINLVTDEPP